jgi:anti-sigma factor RsiW
MTLSDEILMAYADGELDAAQRAEVEAAMAADPDVARRVERHRALRRQFSATYDRVLLETVPDRLIAATRKTPTQTPAETVSELKKRGATVTDLRRVRAARKAEAAEAAAATKRAQPPRPPWGWFEWGAMAASLATGAIIAYLVIQSPQDGRFSTVRGQLVAQADLDLALSHQLASDPIPGSDVRIGVSFKSKTGERCRTFLVKGAQPVGGLACRAGGEWQIQVVANAERSPGPDAGYQQAGAQMPAAVLTAAQNAIDGEPFDAEAEIAARARGWEK